MTHDAQTINRGLTLAFGNAKAPRPVQMEYIRECVGALLAQRPLVIEGPTGLGKTLGLLASVLPFVIDQSKRVVYTTRTITQLRNCMEELGNISRHSPEVKNVRAGIAMGRQSTRKWICNKPSCQNCAARTLKGQFDESVPFDFDAMRKVFSGGACPYLTGRFVVAPVADIVLCTYTKISSESNRREFLGKRPDRERTIFIIDEAHNYFEDILSRPICRIGAGDEFSADVQSLDLDELVAKSISLKGSLVLRRSLDSLWRIFVDRLRSSKEKRRDAKSRLREVKKRISRVQAKIARLARKIATITNEWIPGDKAKLEGLAHKKAEVESEIWDLERRVPVLQKETEALQLDIDAISRELDTHYEQIKQYKGSIDGLYQKKHGLISLIKQPGPRHAKARIAESIDACVQQINRKKEERTALYEEVLTPAKEKKHALVRDFRSKQKELNWVARRLENALAFLDRLTLNMIPRVEQNLRKNEGLVRELNTELAELKREEWQLHQKAQKIEGELQALDARIADYGSRLGKLKANRKNVYQDFFSSMGNFKCMEGFRASVDLTDSATPDCKGVLNRHFAWPEVRDADAYAHETVVNTSPWFGPMSDTIRAVIELFSLLDHGELYTGMRLRKKFLKLTRLIRVVHEAWQQPREKLRGREPALCEEIYLWIEHCHETLSSLCRVPDDYFVEWNENEKSIEIFTLNPGKSVQQMVKGTFGQVFTSATISPVGVMAQVLGNKALAKRLPSPFPVTNYCSYGVMGVSSEHKQEANGKRFLRHEKEVFTKALQEIIIANVSAGIYFSSKATLNELYPVLRKICLEHGRHFIVGNLKNLTQNPGTIDSYASLVKDIGFKPPTGNVERSVQCISGIMEGAAESTPRIPVLMVDIIGGQLAEGVNFKGQQMEAVLLVGIPYPDISSEQQRTELRTKRLTQLTGDRIVAEGIAFRYTAIRKLAQTIGRVHRTPEDKGTIMLLDDRVLGLRLRRDKTANKLNLSRRSKSTTRLVWSILQDQVRETIQPVCYPEVSLKNRQRSLFLDGVGERPCVNTATIRQ